jgi:hypothetical protein
MRERIDEVFGGQLNASFNMDMVFKEESITRKSNALSPLQLEQYLSTSEQEKRQKGNTQLDLEYRHRYFSFAGLRPGIAGDRHAQGPEHAERHLDSRGDGRGLSFPFVYHNDLKFVERKKDHDPHRRAGPRRLLADDADGVLLL